ncbi:hypothetical protein N0V85_005323 [Neurospora sp. IMI 360204]|nr:hypothetical protein N0V85_005323 [Neurospora sp. IMI 360204]
MQQHPQQFQHGQSRQQGQFPQQQFGGPQPQNLFMQPGNYQMPLPIQHQQAPHRGQRRVFAQSFQESDLPQQYFGQSQSPQQHAQVFQHPQQAMHPRQAMYPQQAQQNWQQGGTQPGVTNESFDFNAQQQLSPHGN